MNSWQDQTAWPDGPARSGFLYLRKFIRPGNPVRRWDVTLLSLCPVHVETEMKSITGLSLIPVLLAGSLRGAPRHEDAVRLGGLSQRVPNTCSTNTGAACVFPFLYGGVEYTKCSYADSPVPWCATATRSDGTVITNSWGDCQMDTGTSSCLAETLSFSSCSTPTGDCVFPFRHKGVVYTTCTTVELGVSWCSTLTTQQGEHVAGNEGTCPASCPGSVSTTTTTPTPVCVPGSLSSVDCNTCVCSSLGQQVNCFGWKLLSLEFPDFGCKFSNKVYLLFIIH